MSEPLPIPQTPPALAYDTPLGVGQIRVHQPAEGQLVITVGPPPLTRQLAGVLPVALLLGFLSLCFGLLLIGVLLRPGAIPYDELLLIPVVVVMAFAAVELTSNFRSWSTPCRLTVDAASFGFPYPNERSPVEQVPIRLVDRLNVVTIKTRLLRRSVDALEVGLHHGPRFHLFAGYPRKTLDALTDLLGPALGMTAAP